MSRPVTTGTGVRLSAYIPKALWERLDETLNHLEAASISTMVQEALTRYLDDLNGVEQEGMKHGTDS